MQYPAMAAFVTDEHWSAKVGALSTERQFLLAAEAAEVGWWECQAHHGELIWSPRMKALFGISPNVPVSLEDFYSGLHPDDHEHVAAAYNSATDPALRSRYDVEYRAIGREDGIVRWLAVTGRGIFNELGQCERVVGTATDITARKVAQLEDVARVAALEKAVFHDSLTGTFNRRYFDTRLIEEFNEAIQRNGLLSVIFIDLDRFKSLNDKYGHQTGDMVLMQTCAVIMNNARPCDIVARYGGEEIVVLLPNTKASEAWTAGERIRALISGLVISNSNVKNITTSASIGVSQLQQGENIECFIQRADAAMYQAKELGRNMVCLG